LRVYSSTRLTLVEVQFALYARIRGRSSTGSPTVTNDKPLLCKEHWPISTPFVPYTLYVPLSAGDSFEERRRRGSAIALDPEPPHGRRMQAAAAISGSVPQMNSQFFEAHWYDAERCLNVQPYGEVAVDYEKRARRWGNWKAFE
jgi:hypothetical protein